MIPNLEEASKLLRGLYSLELLWSVQSKSYNPTDIEKVSKEYCNELFKLMEKEKDFRGRKATEK